MADEPAEKECCRRTRERWLATRPVLDRFALHYQTGKPMPDELVQKVARTETFIPT